MAKRKTQAGTDLASRVIKLSVPIDGITHARLAALAAVTGQDRMTIAAEAIRAAVAHVRIETRRPTATTAAGEGGVE